MRAVSYRETGPASVLRVVELPDPEPGPDDVVVRLVRAGVNPTDWKFRAGLMAKAHPEVVPGQDGAGVVVAVGSAVSGVSEVAVGDRVWLRQAQHGRAHGTAAQYVRLPASLVAPLPASASFDLGASLGVPALTAHRTLTSGESVARLHPGALAGAVVLVAGGAGAVGNAAVQLARWAGAEVITTVSSPEKAALAAAAGAQHVVDYRREDVVSVVRDLAPDGVDLIAEVAPAQNLALDLQVLRTRGTIAYYANNGGDEVTMPLRASFSLNLRLQGVLLYTLGEDLLQAGVADVGAAVAAGGFGVGEDAGLPLHHFALEDTAAAHEAVEGGVVGKVLLDLDG